MSHKRADTNTDSTLTTDSLSSPVMDSTVLSKARKARFDDLPSFSGHPSKDVERFLKSIKNITKAKDDSVNHELLEVVRGKLTKSAGIWFDNNESKFTTWLDFETAFRTRYFSTTITHTKFEKLKRRQQKQDESITVYFDGIVDLCHEIDPTMSDLMIIQHLMSGIHPGFKKELSRRQSTILTLTDFLEYAKIEQDLFDTFDKSHKLSIESQPSCENNSSEVPPVTTAVEPKQQQQFRYKNYTFNQSPANQRNSNPQVKRHTTDPPNRQRQQRSPFMNNKSNANTKHTSYQLSKCKVCCFNCGRNHAVRDCTMPPNFQ